VAGAIVGGVNAPLEVRADGKSYPPGGVLPEPQRWRAVNLAHRYRCRDQLSVRQVQAALGRAGIRRSLGMIARDLARYGCDVCDPPEPG
jgi:hypothetical protein